MKMLIGSCIIVGLMLLDNIGELLLNQEDISIAYLFFNTEVYPAGLWGRYLTPIIIVAFCKNNSLFLEEPNSCSNDKIRVCMFKFTVSAFYGGICLSLSRIFFILIMSLFFPFIGTRDVWANLQVWPYFSYSIDGKSFVHIIFIVYYAILSGSLWGGISATITAFTQNERTALAIPFVLKISWIQSCRLFNISSNMRFDYWLTMTATIDTYLTTTLSSGLCTVVSLILLFWLTYSKVRKDGCNA